MSGMRRKVISYYSVFALLFVVSFSAWFAADFYQLYTNGSDKADQHFKLLLRRITSAYLVEGDIGSQYVRDESKRAISLSKDVQTLVIYTPGKNVHYIYSLKSDSIRFNP